MNRQAIWSVIYLGLLGGAGWLVYSNWAFLRDSYRELRYKVTWPAQREVRGTTVVVLITTFAFAFYLFVCDVFMQRATTGILQFFRSLFSS